ncbi:hypothetical protein HDU97_004824 [Phlyctochytrium planicorne]|nr:hypothetical protein HDU97_004824 [Phlyctochytrium planicorne]
MDIEASEKEQDLNAEKAVPNFENDIPAELRETNPIETLSMLDKRFEELLAEIKILTESRGKDFQKIEARVDRMPALPSISYFEKFKTLRKEKLDRASEVEMPKMRETASHRIVDELQNGWNLDTQLSGPKMLSIIKTYLRERSIEILNQNVLLVSRWSRFCRSANEINKFLPSFQKYQEFLRTEYVDTITRYERISEQTDARIRQRQLEQAAKEAERIASERSGIVVAKAPVEKVPNTKLMTVAKEALKAKKSTEKHQRDLLEKEAKEMLEREKLALDETEISEDMANPGFEPEDITLYVRGIITKCKGERDINVFLRRAKLISQTDRTAILKDYNMLASLKPGKNLSDLMNDYEGLNMYLIDMFFAPATNDCQVEDFLTEFEILSAHFGLETPISLEDGRPFVYEIDGRFASKFAEYIAETTYAPYESAGESDSNATTGAISSGNGGANSERSGVGGNSAAVESISAAISAAVNILSSNSTTHATKLRTADWLTDMAFRPIFQDWQEIQKDSLRTRKELDFEIICEFDLLGATDIDFVVSRLKESAKKVWEMAAKKSNTKPLSGKGGSAKQALRRSTHNISTEDEEDRLPASFDLGMLVPDGREHLCDRHVLDGKKQQYGQILRANEESRLIEQELMNVDPTRSMNSASILEPTLATIFAEHEVLAYFQLRFMKTRELRIILQRQLNFLRSVEKRITLDWKKSRSRGFHNFLDPMHSGSVSQTAVANILSSMWNHTKAFNSLDPAANEPRNAQPAAAIPTNLPAVKKTESHEDLRFMRKSKIHITDLKGTGVIYDAALDDLKNLERDMLKLATAFINNGLNGREAISLGYMDELRFKMAERKAEIKDITFLNPLIDRAQLLLEMYDAEVKFHFAKIDAINCYLEVYEHSFDEESISNVCQILTNIIHQRPHFNFETPYFIRDYTMATKSLDIQSRLISETIKSTISSYRDWVLKINSKLQRRGTAKDDPLNKKLENLKVDTPLPFGLPWSGGKKETMSDQQIVMHYESVQLSISEFVPWLAHIPKLWKEAQKQSEEMNRVLEVLLSTFTGGDKPSRTTIDCIVWKQMLTVWRGFSEFSFNPPLRGRRLIGGLDSDVWVENPLLPDLLLSEKYVPYELPTEGNSKALGNSVAPFTMFTDPAFKPRARHFLARLAKLLLLRNRLFFTWIETEFWKSTYEDQFPQMGLNKSAYSGRLGELRYDVPEMVDNTVVEDEEVEDFENSEANHETTVQENVEPAHSSYETFNWRVGPLAIAELDESQSLFDFSKIPNILQFLRPNQLRKISRALKIQILEKNWLMGAVEVHCHLLFDIHKTVLLEKEDDRPKSSDIKKTKSKSGQSGQKDGITNQTFDVDYRTLVTSVLPRKKQMRKAMLVEFAKEHKNITKKEVSEAEKEAELQFLRNELIEWYFRSISEIVVEECERAELAKLMLETRRYALSRPIGKILFRQSRITRNAEYFTNDKGRTGTEQTKKADTDKIIQVQEVVYSEIGGGTDHLLKLWYLPHVTEVLIFPEAANFLTTQHNFISPTTRYNDSKDYEKNIEWDFAKVPTVDLALRRRKMISPFIFSGLDLEAKKCAETKILELDDCLEQYLQATMLNFGENTEEVNRTQMEYLTTCLRLYQLRKEYFRILLNNSPITKEEQVKEAMKTYKIKVLVGAIRLYHKLGSRGGASTGKLSKHEENLTGKAFLLRDEVVTSSIDMEFNRLSQAAFDRCQISMLQNELLRLYTMHMIKNAKSYYDRLADERTGRLFKLYDTIDIQSQNGDRTFSFRLSDDDYNAKGAILHAFVDDLYRANAQYYKEKKSAVAPLLHSSSHSGNGKNNNSQNKELLTFMANSAIEENRIFACTKENLSQAILRLGMQLTKWQETRAAEQEYFATSSSNKLMDLIRNAERTIQLLMRDRKELLENFSRDVRLASAHSISDIYAELASLSVEVNELRKTRRVEERKLRNRIIDEYDEMVSELVIENHVIRNRFNEYRTSTVHEVMGIISETKKEELQQLARSQEIPDALRKAAEKSIKHEEVTSVMKNDIHELNMTLLKVRSMFTLKEQSLRSSYEKKMRKLSEDSRIAEEKLWDSYREAESRERALRRTLTKTTKALIAAETFTESLQRQLKEEQAKARTQKQERTLSARLRAEAANNDAKPAELSDKMKKYDGVNVDKLLSELTEKTKLIEQYVEKERERERERQRESQPFGQTEERRSISRRASANVFQRGAFRPRSSEFRSSIVERFKFPSAKPAESSENIDELHKKIEHLLKENEALKQRLRSRPQTPIEKAQKLPSAESGSSSSSSDTSDKEDEESKVIEEVAKLRPTSSRRRSSRMSRGSVSEKRPASAQGSLAPYPNDEARSYLSLKSTESLDYRPSISLPTKPLAPPGSWAPSANSTPRSSTPPDTFEEQIIARPVVADLSMVKRATKSVKRTDPSPSPSAWTVVSPTPQNDSKPEKQPHGGRGSLSVENTPRPSGSAFFLRRKTLPSRPFTSAYPARRKSSFATEIPNAIHPESLPGAVTYRGGREKSIDEGKPKSALRSKPPR